MELIIIFGPPAVGKMAVGFELEKMTGYRLFHNHMTLELVNHFFDWDEPQFRKLVTEFRTRIFEEVAESKLPGLIFTYVWALDQSGDKEEMDRYCKLFKKKPEDVYFAELYADQNIRLARNKTELRLKHKRSKNNLNRSEARLLDCDKKYILNTNGDFFYPGKHIKINTNYMSALETARTIINKFGLK